MATTIRLTVLAWGVLGIAFICPALAEGLLPPKVEATTSKTVPSVSSVTTAVVAGSPLALIRPFYEHIGSELDLAGRSHFIDPAKAVLDASEALEKSGQGECLDPNMALDNAPADKTEIDKSLRMLETISTDDARVVVAFVEAGSPHRLEWKLRQVAGEWKISDLLSVTGEWSLSQYQCR